MRKIFYSIAIAVGLAFSNSICFAHDVDNISADAALKKLKEGNVSEALDTTPMSTCMLNTF